MKLYLILQCNLKLNIMELELKHLAPYLPYGLKFATLSDDDDNYYIDKERNTLDFGGLNGVVNICIAKYSRQLYKIVLRPLSDLTKEIEHNGEKFVPMLELNKIRKNIDIYQPINLGYPIEINIQTEDYSQEIDLYDGYLIIQKLLKWHFDVFSLIDKNLAIDINTLNK